MEKIV
ncbi:hypothetical protein D039_5199A, partial [Vibrio parahaemolyticus EKP-028]